ncbi:hypothetical protein SK803_41725 [Lentzea sp. BCCO 10_0856]|uniref:Uncharacterized protein n=1 Tax=Lentzea miocenica TaxID=3095431 RepID=A0ABU4TEX7_9PSEU|nr:hypothetical protein [Lentzea sp. BCCO 10_0856]MDX8036754.1 hypothetical protein [Lentzea sp. BCCO 10_0856]
MTGGRGLGVLAWLLAAAGLGMAAWMARSWSWWRGGAGTRGRMLSSGNRAMKSRSLRLLPPHPVRLVEQ